MPISHRVLISEFRFKGPQPFRQYSQTISNREDESNYQPGHNYEAISFFYKKGTSYQAEEQENQPSHVEGEEQPLPWGASIPSPGGMDPVEDVGEQPAGRFECQDQQGQVDTDGEKTQRQQREGGEVENGEPEADDSLYQQKDNHHLENCLKEDKIAFKTSRNSTNISRLLLPRANKRA